jgi:sterol 3beta-glucosyltransferase
MKIGIQTWGSDGDIRPFIALAGGLSNAGHEVTLAITSVDNKEYSDLGNALGFKVMRVFEGFNLSDEEAEAVSKEIFETWDPVKQFTLLFESAFDPALDDMYAAAEMLCAENDVVIGHMVMHPLFSAAEKSGCPFAVTTLCPITVPSEFLSPLGMPYLGRWLNPLLWKLADYFFTNRIFTSVNRLRLKLDLAPIKSVFNEVFISKKLTLVAASPQLCDISPDWGDHLKFSGFFNIPVKVENWTPPSDLNNFLENGEAPVYLTFGSMTQFDLDFTVKLFTDAVKLAGCRAIIQADWDNAEHIPDNPDIFKIGKAPHHEVFPSCAAVVHHGGAGTTQSSIFSGCPSVVVAHAFDQEYWAKQLFRIGVSPKPLGKRSVTPAKLAAAIRNILDNPAMKEKAVKIGRKMSEEDGVGQAVKSIEEIFLS